MERLTLILSRLIFFALFLLLVYAVQRFWFLRAWRGIGTLGSAFARKVLRTGLITLALLLLATFVSPLLGNFFSKIGGGKTVLAIGSLWVGASFFAFLAVKSVRGMELAVNAVARRRSGGGDSVDASRRNFFRYAAYAAGSAPFVVASYGFAAERLRYTVERVEVPVAGLPKDLDGLRIVQMSDIHIGNYMPPVEIARAVDMANELEPDLAVVTGDFVTGVGDPLETCITELSRLRAPLGVWGCNGNHEIYAGVEDDAERLFREKGMRLLRARSAVIERDGASFNLIGVDYQRDHMVSGERIGPMLQEIEHLVRCDMPNVLLSHNPNSFRRAAELGIELSLAGHTHGGQVRFEIVDHNVSPARLITPFVAGLYHLPMAGSMTGVVANATPTPTLAASRPQRAALYVNRGLGTLGFPVRLGAPPEITLLTLRSA